MFVGSRRSILWYPFRAYYMKSVIGQNAWFLCQVLCRSLGDMSADVLFQRSVSALKPDTARRVESIY